MNGKNDERGGVKPILRIPLLIKNSLNLMLYKLLLVFKWFLDVISWGLKVFLTLTFSVIKLISRIIRVFVDFMPHIVDKAVSKKRIERADKSLIHAGIKKDSREIFSILAVYSILFGLTTTLAVYSFAHQPMGFSLTVGLASFLMVWVAYLMIINMLIYRRTESVEAALPDLLEMVAQNMITGMTVYNSLWSAARPEFGPVAEEIQAAAKLTLTGVSLEEALRGVTTRVKSEKLERTIKLITGGMRSGGELPSVLQGVSQDMRMERNLKKQMAAETSAYALFIMFTIFVGTPLLFSISHQFMIIFNTLFEETGISDLISSEGGARAPMGGMMSISKIAVSPEFFMKYAIATVIVISVFGSFIIGLIKTGKPISGLSNIPYMVAIALGVFFLFDYVLNNIFSGMIQI